MNIFNQLKKKKKVIALMIAIVLLFGNFANTTTHTQGQDLGSIEQQLEQVTGQISSLQSEVASNQASVAHLLSQQGSLQQNLSSINALLQEANQKEAQISALIASLQGLKNSAQTSLSKKLALKDASMLALYESSSENPFLEFLSSTDAQSFFYKAAFNQTVIDSQKQGIIDLTNQIKSLQANLDSANTEKATQDQQVQQLNQEQTQLKEELAQVQSSYNSDNEKISIDQKEISTLQSQYGDLSSQEQEIIAAKIYGSGSGQSGGTSSQGASSSNYTPPGSAGTYQLKINNVLISSSLPGPIDLVPNSINDNFAVSGGGANGSYTGVAEFRANTPVSFINETSMENYVAGMGEMPGNWNQGALETQAVAARTYALYNKGAYASSYGYDIPDGCFGQSVCQSYDGYTTGGMQTAAGNTAGQVLYDGSNNFVDSVYSANNGGYERSATEVWGGSKPYLVSQSDVYNGIQVNGYQDPDNMCPAEYYGPAGPSSSGSGVLELSGGVGSFNDIVGIAIYLNQGNSVGSVNPYADYSSYYNNVIGTLTSATFTYNNGKSTNSGMSDSAQENVVNTPSGNVDYVKSATITGSKGSVTLGLFTNDISYIQEAYNLASPGKDVLYTPVWYFTYAGGSSVQFFGFGFGHTVGMSQCGAEGRASNGESYANILSFYYPGTSLKTDFTITNSNAENCKNFGTNYPNNDSCIRVGVDRYSGSDNIITEHDGYTVYVNGIFLFSGKNSDTIELIKN